MSRRRQKADEFRHLAGDVSPEDGTDPKEFHAKPWDAPKKAGRKARQLCRQVAEALHAALARPSHRLAQTARGGSVFARKEVSRACSCDPCSRGVCGIFPILPRRLR